MARIVRTLSPQLNPPTEGAGRGSRPTEEASEAGFRGSSALLFELEDRVAQAAASVQTTRTQVRAPRPQGGPGRGGRGGGAGEPS